MAPRGMLRFSEMEMRARESEGPDLLPFPGRIAMLQGVMHGVEISMASRTITAAWNSIPALLMPSSFSLFILRKSSDMSG